MSYLPKFGKRHDPEGISNLVWLTVYRHSPVDRAALTELLSIDPAHLDDALERLQENGRVTSNVEGEGVTYNADSCLILMGDQVGWEASVFDHFQAVVASVCNKLQNGHSRALPSDQIGGSTFRFDVWSGHPFEDEVCGLLAKHRKEFGALWDRVSSYSDQHMGPTNKKRVTFYFGQSVQLDDSVHERDEG